MGVYDDIWNFATGFFGDPSHNVGNFNYSGVDINITLDASVLRLAEISDRITPEAMATNMALTMTNLFENPSSTSFQNMVSNSPIENLELIFTVRPTDVASIGESEVFGDNTQGYARINMGWLDMEYLSGSQYERFTLQHIVNHEMVHVFTGLPDGHEHNELTNEVNAQTDGGPPSLGYGYFRDIDPDDAIFVHCFGPEVPIDMWPLDSEFAPDPNNPFKQYDQDAVRAKIWKKPISQIKVGDWVVSHDKNGNMVPGYVPRTMTNDAKILLDFHGTRVTPGHVYYRPDSKRSEKYETLIDVLRDDGMIEDRDGVKLRAATYAPVDGPLDKFVKAVTGTLRPDGGVYIKEQGRIRLGTRFIVRNDKGRKDYSVADLIEAGGGVVGDDELIRVGDGPGIPFHWDFSDTLPKPEDFVLAASGTTLYDIYKAAEWESQGPRLPAPVVLDGGPVQPLKGVELSAMPRNEPLNLGHTPEAPQKPQRTMNRKQRKAMEAKSRKAARAQKRSRS